MVTICKYKAFSLIKSQYATKFVKKLIMELSKTLIEDLNTEIQI